MTKPSTASPPPVSNTASPPKASVAALLRPRSVAVIGASTRRGTIGAEILHNIVANGFTGPVYPVHPTARAVLSVRAWPDVRAIPDEIDLAVIVVPRDHVEGIIDACLEKGVKGLLVITAGFKETGPDGAALESRIAAKVRAAGARLVGPNCLGIVTTAAETMLDATFAPTFPPPGTVSIASQSGALGVAMLDDAQRLNIGIRDFVSIGNKADVSGNDLIQWWGADDGTHVILLYLESFGNPTRFAELAREISRKKPIVAVKSGRSARGLVAASSHTGSLAGTDAAVQSLVEDAGLIRVDTVDELFDMAALLAHQPVPRGDRVAILTNAGGPGILATDACEAWGLTVPDLPEAVMAELRSFLPPAASVKNPVDMIASASPEQYLRATKVLLSCGEIDALIVLFVPPITTNAEAVGAAIAEGAAGIDKPVISCFMGRHGVQEAVGRLQRANIPSYGFPESAVRVLARAARYAEWRAKAPGVFARPAGADVDAAAQIVRQAKTDGGWMRQGDVEAALRAVGVRLPESAIAATAGEAATLARRMGFPVVLKAVAEGLVHKTDIGGVRVGIRDESEVFDAWEQVTGKLAEKGLSGAFRGMLVQQMVGGGVETIIGIHRDPSYGPLVMFGLGGVHVELLRDVRFRLAPLTDRAARELVRGIRGFPLLDGFRGAARADVAALEDLLLRLSALATACPDLAELDLNPVKVLADGQGCVAVDARIRLSR